MEGGTGKKKQGSYGKALSSQYFRAHQQHHDHIFVAPGHQGIELEKDTVALVFWEALRSCPPGIPAVIFRVYRALLVLPYLNVTENSSLEEFEREVLTHPVFLLQPAM
jgi:hypothetical protein